MSDDDGAVPDLRHRKARWGIAVVAGDSMRPTLRPGDRLLVDYRRRPAEGAVVIAQTPGRPVVVKRAAEQRVTELGEPGWWLLSDDLERGADSRTFGALPVEDVLGVVVMRIWPPGRIRPVPDSGSA